MAFLTSEGDHMASEPTGPTPQPSGGLQEMLARLKGMVQAMEGDKEDAEEEAVPTAEPVAEPPEAELVEPIAEPLPAEVVPVTLAPCPVCGSDRKPGQSWCGDCGYTFADDGTVPGIAAPVAAARAAPVGPVKQRYELLELVGERNGVQRFKARDRGLSGGDNVPVAVVRQPAEVVPEVDAEPVAAIPVDDEEILPSFDFPGEGPVSAGAPTESIPRGPAWPSAAWERNLLDALEHPGLPLVVDNFSEDGFDYLVLEVPAGRVLWDAWDDPDTTQQQRYAWLAEVADAMHALHKAGAMIEGVRPDIIVVTDQNRARLADLADLLPIPVPSTAPVRGTRYTAPELMSSPASADARADLYSFGGMLYALHVGRELSDADFTGPGQPKPFIPRFPDVHPLFGRLIHKTFMRSLDARFPSDESAREDPTGFTELIRTLRHCGRVLDHVRLEIGAWTTTGIVRTGNEDAFALVQATESRQEDFGDAALIVLADGMGGYEAGEVAAALAIRLLREKLSQNKLFARVFGSTSFASDYPGGHEGNVVVPLDVAAAKAALEQALRDVNRQIYTMSRTPGGPGRRGMGCTTEVVYVDSQNVVVGHVGDSRTYHLHEGRLIQMTRDQTLVNRLVELGTISAEEAENHPRKNELQQAMGGQPDVRPDVYAGRLKPGDVVLVCSDGLTNHVTNLMLKQFLQNEAFSAELAARRLCNLALIENATDNATTVVVRAV
jgi:protein phosphatase